MDTIVAKVQGVPGDDRCVLLLGYEDQMREMMRRANPGLARRFQLQVAGSPGRAAPVLAVPGRAAGLCCRAVLRGCAAVAAGLCCRAVLQGCAAGLCCSSCRAVLQGCAARLCCQ